MPSSLLWTEALTWCGDRRCCRRRCAPPPPGPSGHHRGCGRTSAPRNSDCSSRRIWKVYFALSCQRSEDGKMLKLSQNTFCFSHLLSFEKYNISSGFICHCGYSQGIGVVHEEHCSCHNHGAYSYLFQHLPYFGHDFTLNCHDWDSPSVFFNNY